jgi:hypothetical protein
MCLFSGQRIAYQMTAAVPDSLAMVLPIPTPPNPAEDAVTFVDLSSCPTFFDHLDALFPIERDGRMVGLSSCAYSAPSLSRHRDARRCREEVRPPGAAGLPEAHRRRSPERRHHAVSR